MEAQIAEVLTQKAFQRLVTPEVPEHLSAASIRLTPELGGGALVTTYSTYDPLRLSSRVLEVLPYFDGRRTDDVVADIRETRGLEVTPTLLQRLVDFEVLEIPGSSRPI